MNQLQAKFHLPDFIITEISRHVHQLFIIQLNQEYHQTWRLADEYLSEVFLTRNKFRISISCNDRYPDITGHIYNFCDFEYMPVARLPNKYWYSSGNYRQDGYQ